MRNRLARRKVNLAAANPSARWRLHQNRS